MFERYVIKHNFTTIFSILLFKQVILIAEINLKITLNFFLS